LNLIQSVTLGIVQGITEWLPISSNAHLKIVPELLHWPDPGAPAVAVMQLGTMAAVITYYWKDITTTLAGMVRAWRPGGDRNSPEARLGLAILVGTIPICIAGLLLKKFIEGAFRSDYVIAGALVIAGILLLLAERFAKQERPLSEVTVRDGLIVGVAQAFALVPGTSRSGSTLTGAFLTGLNREAAVRFSFLLSIPAVLLSGLYELKDFYEYYIKKEPLPSGVGPVMDWTPADLAIATVVAGLVGYASIAFLVKYLAKHSTLAFVVYRILLAVVLVYLVSTGQIGHAPTP
jgi:undecaprenyl-diphosphatase